ncbi:MAG: response regulator [Actinomycetota bacterium]|nr:response regulator [Actinomycetota bacterium]
MPPKIKILIVDDAMFMRNRIKQILLQGGYDDIIESANGKEAIESYKKHRPDLVTMDIIMPDMNGIAALVRIKAFDPQAKVVVITAMGQRRIVVDAIKAGAMDFVTKPFKKEKVLETIHQVLTEPEAWQKADLTVDDWT